MAEYEKKSKTWRGNISLSGKRYRKRGFLSKKNAQIWENQMRYKYEREELGLPVAERVEINHILNTYLEHVKEYRRHNTYISQQRAMRIWQQFFMSRDIVYTSEINLRTWDDFREYRSVMSVSGTKPGTLNLDLGAIRQAFKFAISKRIIHKNPFEGIESYRQKKSELPRYLTTEEIETIEELAAEINPLFHLCFSVLVRTGLRVGELCSLGPRNIDLERNQILLFPEQTKAREMRRVPFGEKVRGILVELLQEAQENNRDYLFCTKIGSRQSRSNIYRRLTYVLRELEKQGKIANIDEIHVHTLRRTYISHLIMKGVDPVKVMAIVGHKDWKTVKMYLVLSPQYLAEGIDVLPY